jgi:DNA-binding NarL/FixJ family response regulator
MGTRSAVRVLVVDDYEPFRRFVCATLGARPELQVVGEAADGLQAVQKAEELQPDLILLDVGLPKLNGIEAAHRISRLVPVAKILFVSQENDTDVIAAALSDGAEGYLRKQNAVSEPLSAVETLLRGDRFVSAELIVPPTQVEDAKSPATSRRIRSALY